MTLSEAKAYVGAAVTYRSHHGAPLEEGEIASVGSTFVFVRCRGDIHSKATRPEDLELAHEGAA